MPLAERHDKGRGEGAEYGERDGELHGGGAADAVPNVAHGELACGKMETQCAVLNMKSVFFSRTGGG